MLSRSSIAKLKCDTDKKKKERSSKCSAFKPTDCTEQYTAKPRMNQVPRLQTESIFCHHKLKWWLWDERMKTMYSLPSCFAEPNLHPFPRTAHFTNIRRRFSIVSNCHHSFPSTVCLWKRSGTHSHEPLMFSWVLSYWISWAHTEDGVSLKREKHIFKKIKVIQQYCLKLISSLAY